MKKIISIAIFSLSILGSKSQHVPQDPNRIPQLRAAFVKAFEKNFELQKDEIIDRANFRYYWVATVKPKDTGIFTIRYNFNVDTNGTRVYRDVYYEKGYPNFDRGTIEFTIKVVNQKQSQNPYLYSDTTLISLDEHLLIPIKIDDIYTDHVFFSTDIYDDLFANKSRENKQQAARFDYLVNLTFGHPPEIPMYAYPEYDNFDNHEVLFKWDDKTLFPELSYYKSDYVYSKYLNPATYMNHNKYYQDLYFKARQIGKWDLKIKSHIFLLGKGYGYPRTEEMHHIIIINKNTSAFVLPWVETEYRYMKNKPLEGKSNYNFYPTYLQTVKVGEIFKLPILSTRQTYNYDMIKGIFNDGPFSIQKQPLNTDNSDDFSSWLIEKY